MGMNGGGCGRGCGRECGLGCGSECGRGPERSLKGGKNLLASADASREVGGQPTAVGGEPTAVGKAIRGVPKGGPYCRTKNSRECPWRPPWRGREYRCVRVQVRVWG